MGKENAEYYRALAHQKALRSALPPGVWEYTGTFDRSDFPLSASQKRKAEAEMMKKEEKNAKKGENKKKKKKEKEDEEMPEGESALLPKQQRKTEEERAVEEAALGAKLLEGVEEGDREAWEADWKRLMDMRVHARAAHVEAGALSKLLRSQTTVPF